MKANSIKIGTLSVGVPFCTNPSVYEDPDELRGFSKELGAKVYVDVTKMSGFLRFSRWSKSVVQTCFCT